MERRRYAVSLWLWEIRAGKLDPGEGPDECVARGDIIGTNTITGLDLAAARRHSRQT
jgi:8-oxo-dGTP pyrophosphatase MutT (NUDIX family)